MQNFHIIDAPDQLSDSRSELNENFETILSNNSGTAFPVTNLKVGMKCWRTDQQKLYMLVSTGPDTWVQIPVTVPVPVAQGGTGAVNAADARTNLGLGGLAVKNSVAASEIDAGAVTTPKINDGALSADAAGRAKMADGYVTGAKLASGAVTTNLGFTPVNKNGDTLTGYLILHADPDAAMKAATKQYVDTRVQKAGDTMTGQLTIDKNDAHLRFVEADADSGSKRNWLEEVNNDSWRIKRANSAGAGSADYADKIQVNNVGQIWTQTYGWMHGYFFNSVTNCAGGSTYQAINCYGGGNVYQGTQLELVDNGGIIQLRGVNSYTNCNCDCACACDCNCCP